MNLDDNAYQFRYFEYIRNIEIDMRYRPNSFEFAVNFSAFFSESAPPFGWFQGRPSSGTIRLHRQPGFQRGFGRDRQAGLLV